MAGKRVLIIGGGGREHALAWGVSRSRLTDKIFAAPGSDGMADLAERVAIDPNQPDVLADWAEKQAIDLTIVGPEAYLATGLADTFKRRGLPVFGPVKSAARLEWSKVFAKQFMARYKIPTADFQVFDDPGAAERHIERTPGPWVVKADGLAAGKGVVVADTPGEALAAVRSAMIDRKFGPAGQQIIIEEKLVGEELSLLAVCDGRTFRPLLPAQDHKRIGEGDTGPNTGGMGAYAPTSLFRPELAERIDREILAPTILGMAEEGTPFTGVLYAGLMLTREGPKVVEYNVRFGDPETQAVIPLLQSDLMELFLSAVSGDLASLPPLRWRDAFSACVVLAAEGYPGAYRKGEVIHGLDELDDVIVFHAGTRREGNDWLTDGGRVLNVVGIGPEIDDALASAYTAVDRISFNGCYYRKDIGWRELRRRKA